MQTNTKNTDPTTIGDQTLEVVDKFTYLGSVIAVDGGTEKDAYGREGSRCSSSAVDAAINGVCPGTTMHVKSRSGDIVSTFRLFITLTDEGSPEGGCGAEEPLAGSDAGTREPLQIVARSGRAVTAAWAVFKSATSASEAGMADCRLARVLRADRICATLFTFLQCTSSCFSFWRIESQQDFWLGQPTLQEEVVRLEQEELREEVETAEEEKLTLTIPHYHSHVRIDFSIIQFAQSLYNRQDPTKYEFIRQKLC
ncbi:unnamed protein product [Pleuronectes platessa]|uniref:Uncharacterized protein n=1 Tax=Pleuronectes platessa TaxID=8262 RepID=A0A9N7Z5G2_PLEPL|nr:unnamed protein product [Pleuronectes platessa]